MQLGGELGAGAVIPRGPGFADGKFLASLPYQILWKRASRARPLAEPILGEDFTARGDPGAFMGWHLEPVRSRCTAYRRAPLGPASSVFRPLVARAVPRSTLRALAFS